MRIATVLGTRPEIIRLARIIERLDECVEHLVVHTEQNFEPGLSQVFFEELGIRMPDVRLGVRGELAEQVAQILTGCERVFRERRPDRLLVLGDTNSGLAAFIAKRLGIPVFHMEAGNRCRDDRVPEEVNRRVVDACSDILLPYTERSRDNLLAEGVNPERIYVTGNPIGEVIAHFREGIAASTALARLGLEHGGFLLATLHRAENVDLPARFAGLRAALSALSREHGLPVVVSTHPRTRARLAAAATAEANGDVRFVDPFGFFDFIHLEGAARCVLTDSGTVQEECAILHVPSVTLRDSTERPETVECGASLVAGGEPEAIRHAVRTVLARPPRWQVPAEYQVATVSETVVRIVTAHHHCLAGPRR